MYNRRATQEDSYLLRFVPILSPLISFCSTATCTLFPATFFSVKSYRIVAVALTLRVKWDFNHPLCARARAPGYAGSQQLLHAGSQNTFPVDWPCIKQRKLLLLREIVARKIKQLIKVAVQLKCVYSASQNAISKLLAIWWIVYSTFT